MTGWPFFIFIYYSFISIPFFFLLKKEGGSIWIFISGDELPCLESAFLLVRVCLLLEQTAAKKGIKWTTNISQKRLRFLCSQRLVGAPRVVCCGIYVASGAISQEGRFASSACWRLPRPPIWYWRLPRSSPANSIIHPLYRISSSVRSATKGGRAGEERVVARSGPPHVWALVSSPRAEEQHQARPQHQQDRQTNKLLATA